MTKAFIFDMDGTLFQTDNGRVAGLVIGLTLAFVHILGIALTGTSVNPARSLAPAVLLGGTAMEQVWVFLTAPLAGGFLAAVVHRFLNRQ